MMEQPKMTPEEIKKLQLLKMIIKCQKSKKHKPKKVARAKLKIDGITSTDFPNTLPGISYRGDSSVEIREVLTKIVDES